MNDIQKRYWESSVISKRRTFKHPVIKSYVISKLRAIENFVVMNKNTKILEVGAGNGFFSYYLNRMSNLTVTDYSKKMIELNPVKNKSVMSVENIKFPDNSFDVVFEANLLHHVKDFDKALSEMKRVSKRYVVLIEPNRNNPFMFLFGLFKKVERNSLKFSLNFLNNKVTKNKMSIVASFSHGLLLPNKTPKFLLTVLQLFDGKIKFFGFYNVIICEKIL